MEDYSMPITIPILYRTYEEALANGGLPFPLKGIPCAR
jgi:hypothetical protein